MKKSAEIRQELAGLVNSQNEIWNVAKAENRSALNEEETRKFNEIQTQIDAKASELRVAEKSEENARLFGGAGSSAQKPEEREMGKIVKDYSIHKVMRSLSTGNGLDGVERELNEEYSKEARAAGIPIGGYAIPIGIQKRADGQTVTQDSGGYGGNMVQTNVGPTIEFLRPKLVLESLGARYLTGLTGNVKFPKNNGGVTANWEGEVDAAARTKNAIGSLNMAPKRLAASVLVSIQNLMQTGSAIEIMTIEDINAAIAEKIDGAAINGSGSGDIPLGILNTSGIGAVALGANGAAATWPKIVELETAVHVANANGVRMGYLINAATRGHLKTTVKVSGQPQYLMGEDGRVNSYNTAVTNLVPSNLTKGSGTNLSAVVFGDFSQLIIGTWAFADLTIDRVSAIEEGYHKFVVNTFNDMGVRHAGAFAAIKDLVTA